MHSSTGVRSDQTVVRAAVGSAGGVSEMPSAGSCSPIPKPASGSYYEYNFENEFPYTPNVRGVRTDEWKYIHYPNGEGVPDTQKAELYNLKDDPAETHNLIDAPEGKEKAAELRTELARLIRDSGAEPDRMPPSPVIRAEMPADKIR